MSSAYAKKTIYQELEERMNLKSIETLRTPQGLHTGVNVIDDFLYWKGLPKGDLVLFNGHPNDGAARLWLQTSQELRTINKKSAWIKLNNQFSSIQEHSHMSQFLVPNKGENSESLYLVLKDLILSNVFTLIGCSIEHSSLCIQHLYELKSLCQQQNVTLTFISQSKHLLAQPVFPLVIDCQEDFYTIHKAVHRPTPMVIAGSMIERDLSPSPNVNLIRYIC